MYNITNLCADLKEGDAKIAWIVSDELNLSGTSHQNFHDIQMERRKM